MRRVDLTVLGESLLEPLNALVAWAEANQARIGEARVAFDATAAVAVPGALVSD